MQENYLSKTQVISAEKLKLIAAAAMLCDHIGVILFPRVTFLRVIGRIAFPVFAYMIAEGCIYTKNKTKYLLKLLITGVVAQLVISPFRNDNTLNILFTFAISAVMIFALQYGSYFKKDGSILSNPAVYLVLFMALMVDRMSQFAMPDYGMWGCLAPVAVYAGSMAEDCSSDVKRLLQLFLLGLCLVFITQQTADIQIYSLWALPLLLCYSGKRDNSINKNFFYVFYPAHLALLYIISLVI